MLLAELSLFSIPFPQVLLSVGLLLATFIGLSGLYVCATSRKYKSGRSRACLSRLLYLAFLGLIAVLAISSFSAILRFGHMSGYALFAHIAAAGGFVLLLVFVALLYLPTEPIGGENALRDNRWWLARWSAWALVISSIAVAATMLLSMLPMFDTDGLLAMADLHRFAGLAVVVAAIVHAYALGCTRLGWR